MRLFTGLDLPPEVAGRLADLLERLRPAARIAWSPPANLHITTKFIGEWPEERLEELRAALAGVAAGSEANPIPVHVGGLGFYPNPRAPRVFWCGMEAPGLAELAAETDAATARLGVQSEKRAFSPHLTLARIKRAGTDLTTLHQWDGGPGHGGVRAALRRAVSFFTEANCGQPVLCTLNLRSFPSQNDDRS